MKVVLECFVHRCFDLENLGLIDVGSYDVTKLKDNIYVLQMSLEEYDDF